VDRFKGNAQARGDFSELAFSEKIEMLPDDPAFQGVFPSEGLKLEEKSFGEGTGGDAWRMKRLDQGKGLFDLGWRGVGGGADFREIDPEKPVFIQVADDFGGCGADCGIDLSEGQLGGEVIGQGFGEDSGFEEGLAGIEAGTIGSRRCDGPIRIAGRKVRVVLIFGGDFSRVDRAEFFFEDRIGLKFSLKKILKFQGGGL
jgi:hypothetical protein